MNIKWTAMTAEYARDPACLENALRHLHAALVSSLATSIDDRTDVEGYVLVEWESPNGAEARLRPVLHGWGSFTMRAELEAAKAWHELETPQQW